MHYNLQFYAQEFFRDVWPIFAVFTTFFLFLILLDLAIRAIALWKAARADQMVWFIALTVFNTMGILPLIYLLFFVRKPATKVTLKQTKNKKAS